MQERARLAKRSDDGLPVRFDGRVDAELQNLICWIPTDGKAETTRSLTADERNAVDARTAALELALRPFDASGRAEVEASIAAMFSGFRSMRQQAEDVDSVVEVTVAVLRDFPAWAISMACLNIARRETRHDRFAPNDAEIVDVVREIVGPYRKRLDGAQRLLDAVRGEKAAPRPTAAELKAKLGRPIGERPSSSPDDEAERMQRVADDLAARKARRQGEEESRA